MCYYNTIKISQRDLVKMKGIELPLLDYERPVQSGFEFRSWPIIRPTTDRKNLRVDLVHWEFIPESVHDIEALQQARQKFTWLNAKAENLLRMTQEDHRCGRPLHAHDVAWFYLPAFLISAMFRKSAQKDSH
ncbi:MAG: hypothetical protein NVV59_01575 [Chitinophagaceae bacterium]|nr:hypothetical protein [Chitinophagaceae bacterium]